MVAVHSWGRLGSCEHTVHVLADRTKISDTIRAAYPGLAYGNGRSYGDVCLNPGGHLWQTGKLDRFIDFDPLTGRMRCEAGVLLRDIQTLMIARGWILPVTPGTSLVTVGGAIANDVHGKNHHLFGSFGDHVTSLTLVRTYGEVIECGPDSNSDWYAATVGGLGLTGLISEVEIQLRPVSGPWIDSDLQPFACLNEFFELADNTEAAWEHSVAWIDCIGSTEGRGIFMRGNHTASDRKPPSRQQLTIPLTPPFSLVNRQTLSPFNTAYYHSKKCRTGRSLVFYEPYLYPLDSLLEWNRIYGPRGFYQYQALFPRASGRDAVASILRETIRSGMGSPLAVLKTFGNRASVGMLGFPRPGVTLALDFPNRCEATLSLFERFDAIVRESGGRLYPAKDARMSANLFLSGYPRLSEFIPYRDPGISSAFSRRVLGH